jgi:hypothetical protein
VTTTTTTTSSPAFSLYSILSSPKIVILQDVNSGVAVPPLLCSGAKESAEERFMRNLCRSFELYKKLENKEAISPVWRIWAMANPMASQPIICHTLLEMRRKSEL